MHYTMKAYRRVDVRHHIFLTSALAGGEWSASCPGHFTPGKRASGTHWIRGWVDPWAGVDDMVKWKFLPPSPAQIPTPWSSSRWPVAIPSTLSQVLRSLKLNIKSQKMLYQGTLNGGAIVLRWNYTLGKNQVLLLFGIMLCLATCI
jgi:hypothetical protein